MDLVQGFENSVEVFRTASSLLLIYGILDFSVKRLDEFLGGTGIGEDVGAVVTKAEIPDFTVIPVCDLDMVFAQAGCIESPCPVGNQ